MTSLAKSLFITTSLILLVGCSSSSKAQIQSSPAEQSEIASNSAPSPSVSVGTAKTSKDGWEVAVTDVRPGGRVYKNDYTEYEAAKSWTLVSISITNKTGERQQDGDAPGGLWSKMIDSTGKEYDLEEVDYVDLTDKPFSPGETRSEILLFDTPENITPAELVLDQTEDDSPRLKLN